MAKLIKTSSDHYIVTDDEEIIKGDFIIYNGEILEIFDFNVGVFPKNLHKFVRTLSTCYNIMCGRYICFPESIQGNKITHSTKPLEYGIDSFTLIFDKIKELSLTGLNN